MERFNELLEQVLPRVPARPAPSASTSSSTPRPRPTGRRLLPDGIHFTSDTRVVVADSWLGPHVVEAADDLRRADADADLGG